MKLKKRLYREAEKLRVKNNYTYHQDLLAYGFLSFYFGAGNLGSKGIHIHDTESILKFVEPYLPWFRSRNWKRERKLISKAVDQSVNELIPDLANIVADYLGPTREIKVKHLADGSEISIIETCNGSETEVQISASKNWMTEFVATIRVYIDHRPYVVLVSDLPHFTIPSWDLVIPPLIEDERVTVRHLYDFYSFYGMRVTQKDVWRRNLSLSLDAEDIENRSVKYGVDFEPLFDRKRFGYPNYTERL